MKSLRRTLAIRIKAFQEAITELATSNPYYEFCLTSSGFSIDADIPGSTISQENEVWDQPEREET